MTVTAAIIVGNPKTKSRTRDAAELLAAALGAEASVLEVAELGPGLLDFGSQGDATPRERMARKLRTKP